MNNVTSPPSSFALRHSAVLKQETLQKTENLMRSFFPTETEFTQQAFDLRRIATVVDYIRKYDLDCSPCVEIGSLKYASAQIVWSQFPHCSPSETTCDLRSSILPFEDNSTASVICTEVIEHLSDCDYAQATTLSGLLHFLSELYRILRVGGRALITTPNASSLWALYRACRGEQPMMYDWHFREYTCEELSKVVRHIGFNIIDLNTEFVWYLYNFDALLEFLHLQGYSCDRRGDDIFLVLEKPLTPSKEPLELALPI